MTAALLAVAGRPTMPGVAPVTYTIPWNLKITAGSQLTKVFPSGLGNAGSAATDTTSPLTGGQTAHVRISGLTGGGSHWYFNGITSAAPISLTGRYFRYRFRQNLGGQTTRFLYWVFADSLTAFNAGNYVKYLITPGGSGQNTSNANWLPDTTWVWDGFDPVLDTAQLTVAGTGITSWGAVGYVAIQPWSTTSPAPTLDIAEIQVVTKASSKAKCLFWHDDLTLVGAQALVAKLNTYGWKYSEAAIWEAFGGGGDMAAADGASYTAAGDVFAVHAITHAEHVQQTPQQLYGQAVRSRLAIWARQFTNTAAGDFTWWGGQLYTQTYLDVIRQFYRSGRGNTQSMNTPEMIPPADPHLYKSVLTATTDTYATWQAAVDRAIATKGFCSFVFHQNLGDPAGTSDTYKSNLDSLLTYLDGHRANIDVITVADLMALCT